MVLTVGVGNCVGGSSIVVVIVMFVCVAWLGEARCLMLVIVVVVMGGCFLLLQL